MSWWQLSEVVYWDGPLTWPGYAYVVILKKTEKDKLEYDLGEENLFYVVSYTRIWYAWGEKVGILSMLYCII